MNIRIEKSIIKNKNITHEGFMVYVGFICMSRNKIDTLYSTISCMELLLKDSFSEDRYFRDKIKKGLCNLKDNGVILFKCKNDIKDIKPNDHFVVKITEVCCDSVEVGIDGIINITSQNAKRIDVDKILKYYICFIMSIDTTSCVGRWSVDVLSGISGVSDNTILTRYNKILEELELIYIYKYNCGNFYGLYKDKDIIDKYVEEYKNKISENREESSRSYADYNEFVSEVLFRDDYTCQHCKIRGGRLNVHHLNGYHWDVENRTNPDNGITLCDDCHKKFHNRYGRGKNTKEQFDEFIFTGIQ